MARYDVNHRILIVFACLYVLSWAVAAGQPRDLHNPKRILLNELAMQRRSLPPNDLVTILRDGLSDPDPDIRVTALAAVTGRAGLILMKDTPEVRARWAAERAVMLSLRPKVLDTLADPDPDVRVNAVIALVNLSYELGGPKSDYVIEQETVRRLADAYRTETAAQVATQIMKTFELAVGDDEIRAAVLQLGLTSEVPGVLVHAIRGVGNMQIPSALGRIADLINHSDRAVRLAVAQAFFSYGSQASPYLPRMKEAWAREKEPAVKKTIEATIAYLERG